MRKEKDLNVDVHTRALKAATRTHSNYSQLQGIKHEPQVLTGVSAWINRHFEFPKGELAIVAENGSKLSIPYPLLAAILGLFIWMGGGTIAAVWALATISANVSNLSTSVIQSQAAQAIEKKQMQEKLELQQVYITDLREKIIRLETKNGRN